MPASQAGCVRFPIATLPPRCAFAGVPWYYFDIADGDRRTVDDEGTELEDDEDARDEALETLGEIAKDKLPDGDDRRDFVITVREGQREVLTATLALRVEREA
jgi:hypothetical protein